jgi:hypothetical protein
LFSSSCATLPGCAHRSWRRSGHPPRRAVRRRHRPTARTSALDRSCAPPASPLCFLHAKPCPVARIRVSSSELCRAPPLTGVAAAARAPASCHRRPISILRCRSLPGCVNSAAYRSTQPLYRLFCRKVPQFYRFTSIPFRSSKILTIRSFLLSSKP